MKWCSRCLIVFAALIILGIIILNTGYFKFLVRGVTFILDTSNGYIFETQEAESIQFTFGYSSISDYCNNTIAGFGGSQLQIKSITKEGKDLRIILNAKYDIKYTSGNIIQDLPSPDIAEITVIDQRNNQYEVIYNGASSYRKRERDYHYLISINENVTSDTRWTMTISDVIPIVYRRK